MLDEEFQISIDLFCMTLILPVVSGVFVDDTGLIGMIPPSRSS